MVKRMTAGFIIFSVALIFVLTACGSEKKEMASDVGSATVENGEETSGGTHAQKSPQVSDGKSEKQKILIAYFTWANNTKVDKPDAVDVDASTSASVLPPGNAAMLAGWIQEETGGDLFSIQVTEPYSSDYDECLDRAADEEAKKARPPLKSRVEDMDSYEIVFLGFPNWWYTVPMAIHSFVEEYDFSGKTVIPFVTHGTGGLASCIDDFKSSLPDSVKVLEPIGVYRDDVKSAKPKIQKWIADWRNG